MTVLYKYTYKHYCLKCEEYIENKSSRVSNLSNGGAKFPAHFTHCVFL